MVKIIPFAAVRPTKDKVSLVVSRSYEDYPTNELNATLSYNPFSFLHIINPGYKFHHDISGERRFSLVRNRYLEFIEENVFTKDESPSLYIYKIKTRKGDFCGIFAGASVEDYQNNSIKKHEATLQTREELFKDYLKTVGFNAEPVLLTYPDNAEIDAIITTVTKEIPEYEFATTDKAVHYLWKISNLKIIDTIQQVFKKMDCVYIADGHHRSASSNLLSEELKSNNPDHTGKEPYNYFMSYFIPESNLKIYDFNRMVKDLNGLSKEEFLIQLDEHFRIENRGDDLYKPSKKHHFGMYLDGEFYSLYLRKHYEFSNSLSELDTHILYITVLKPILGIEDLRNDNRIEYGYGKYNTIKMKDFIDQDKFKVGFSLFPVKVDQMKKISDEGLKMPPKSTYIEPKLKSGLTIYEF
ncbi:DUF1015 domain-containing protein [Galbibacter pacificus]|uniref:DUF1015 domain-containing protein n=1 Tax=Galbibacter pacificus TaxID=2996052 RepID=A0ABT6FPZ5_9FLAO|nr:DUF1015 domain-containing protein [Galbibacter pacificus]MDG3582201.1 DUF1015 domain-containing protein [Galbibacter pacificus]MDG3585323.1 DUF1015 domain-containing protein [Galbibacter pacificus]